jgi:hypothetical protein
MSQGVHGILLLVVEYDWSICLFRQYRSTRKQHQHCVQRSIAIKRNKNNGTGNSKMV